MADHPITAGVEAGKLIGYEVYRSGGELVDKVTFDRPVSNYMNPVMLSRLAGLALTGFDQAWQGAPPALVRCSQLGVGATPNPRSDQLLEAPIGSMVDGINNVGETGTDTGGFRRADVNYWSTWSRSVPHTDPDTLESYNEPRITHRVSHRHTVIPAGGSSVVVSEIGWSNSTTGLVTSRIVLPPDKRITLLPEQFLVTIYEFTVILPDLRVRPFSNLPITGAFRWANLPTYALGQVVTDGGVNYKSLVAGNKGNKPADNPDKWELDTTTPMVLSGQYAFRGAFSDMASPAADVVGIGAWGAIAQTNNTDYLNTAGVISGNGDLVSGQGPILSTRDTLLPEGSGLAASFNREDGSDTTLRGHHSAGVRVTYMSADMSDAAEGKVTLTARVPRDVTNTISNVRSIVIAGHQFLLDRPIARASDQEISITCSIQWRLVQELGE